MFTLYISRSKCHNVYGCAPDRLNYHPLRMHHVSWQLDLLFIMVSFFLPHSYVWVLTCKHYTSIPWLFQLDLPSETPPPIYPWRLFKYHVLVQFWQVSYWELQYHDVLWGLAHCPGYIVSSILYLYAECLHFLHQLIPHRHHFLTVPPLPQHHSHLTPWPLSSLRVSLIL